MKATIKINPVRVRVPKYGNGLMLLMEFASRYTTPILGKITDLEKTFDVELRMSRVAAQSAKKYINLNL